VVPFPGAFINIDLFLIFIILFDVEVRARLKTLPFQKIFKINYINHGTNNFTRYLFIIIFLIIIYGIAIGNVYIALLLYRIIKFINYFIRRRTTFFLLKYILYFRFIRRRRFINLINRGFIIFIIIYWAETVVYN